MIAGPPGWLARKRVTSKTRPSMMIHVRFLVVASDLLASKDGEVGRAMGRRQSGLGQRRRPKRSILSEMEILSSAATVFQVSWQTRLS